MEIEYDHAKNDRNIRERNLSFEQAELFDFSTAISGPVFRSGELRTQAIGYYRDRLHVLCFKDTDPGIRVISFRKANEREAKKYGLALRR